MSDSDELMKLDLYGIIGVAPDATEKEITKAYRKAALKCHPDKNPDKKAHEEFKRLGKILDILCNPAKRATFDQQWKAKKAAAERVRQLDSKRRKLRDDLEERERAAMGGGIPSSGLTEKQRIEKLREEGLRLLENERKLGMARQTLLNKHVRAKWDPKLEPYKELELKYLLKKYGNVISVKMVGKCSAIIEFETRDAALHSMQELGRIENPLDLDLLDESEVIDLETGSHDQKSDQRPPVATKRPAPVIQTGSFDDFEAEMLQKMMAAAQQKNKQNSQ